MSWENVDRLNELFEKLTTKQKLDYYEDVFGEQLGELWKDWDDEIVDEDIKRLKKLIEKNEKVV